MNLFEPHLITKKEIRFPEGLLNETSNAEESFGDIFGGIIKSGQWGWLTKGSRLSITSLRSGQPISKYDFDASNGFGVCIITCVTEIQLLYSKDTIIAIGIQYADSPGGLIVLYCVEESTVICCIELKHKITCCKFISHEVSQHTVLQNMSGCLAVGTDAGSVLLVDLNLRNLELPVQKNETGISLIPCHIVDYSLSLLHLHRHFKHCQQEGVHFGIQLEVLENAEFIQSLLPIDVVLGLAVGLADGRLVLYDLTDMQVFYIAPPQERSSPLVKMSAMEPPDDPRPCVYIWAFHENYQNSTAVMHSLMYEKRVVTPDGFCYFENFQVSSVRLQLPLSCPKSVPIACQSITKAPSHGNEEVISLCALVWKQEQELQTEVLLFDINQWYKEEMPYIGDWREDPSYLASFVLPGLCCLDMYFNPNTISLFNSIQRPEEHFYPLSLSFDSIAMEEKSCLHLNWPGVQNRVVNVLRSQGSMALLDPNPIFNEVLNAHLLPQFTGLNYKATFSLKAKRETLLSVAIENNCNGLLKECAKNWSDGSHQATYLGEGLSLSTLTDWLWERASNIKERCNKLCKVLFDHSGYTLDQREKQELCFISKQLRTLAELSSDIVSKYGENIPSDVLNTLKSQGNSIRMASDYQEILLWLLNIGLLPEGSNIMRNLVPYPYDSLHGFYEKRRTELMRYSSRKTRSCYLLFIDAFLEHSFKGNTLRDCWQESGGDGLYPPTSVQAMLRILLITDVSFENKCALFLYFFLDLNMAIEDKRYEPIVQNFIKFPSVFKLSASLIKQIQSFWNLDHCHFQAAVDEFISPFNKDHVCPQWQIELFIASLLNQMESNLALRVLEAKSLPISPILQLNVYLANDLISEAFHFARDEKDEELLKLFFSRCLLMKKFGVIRDLALTDSEGKLVQSLLKNSKNRNAEDLSFVYLLQKYKYIDATAYKDELSRERDLQRTVDDLSKARNNQSAMDIDTGSLVLSAYHTTMTPITKNISDVYMRIKKRIKNKETEVNSPYPLSCQLIKQNASDLLGGIYHSSALSTHFASHYWDQQNLEGNALQQSANAPFLRSPQISLSISDYSPKETISYPEPFKPAQKRRLDNSPVDSEKLTKIRENPKKRRKIFGRYDFELSTSENLLTQFKNSTSYNQEVNNLTNKTQKTSSRESSVFLETPYVKNNPTESSSFEIPTKQVIPGILKLNQPKISADETDRIANVSEEREKKKESEDEKSIRFVLPVDESLEKITDVSVENEKQSSEKQENQSTSYSGPLPRKTLRSTAGFTSLIPMSKNELQGILDKVNNEKQKQNTFIKLNKLESTASMTKSLSKEVLPMMPNIMQDKEQPYEELSNEVSQEDSLYSLNTDSKRRPGPKPRKSLKSASIRNIDLQINNEPVIKTTSIFESSSSIVETTSSFGPLKPVDLLKLSESEKKLHLEHSMASSTSFDFPKSSISKSEPEIVSMEFNTKKTDEQRRNPDITKFECLSYHNPNLSSAKRALSESSDSNSNDLTLHKKKHFKGRASIHSSTGNVSDDKAETTAIEIEKVTTTILQETKTVFSTDTLSDFKPHISSSKVCSSESKFEKESKIEFESELVPEKSPLKETFSERTTIIGELTHLPTMDVPENMTELSNVTLTGTEKEQMLDTTVGMSLYDTMGFEEHPLEEDPTIENSSSTRTYENLDDKEEEPELNNLDFDEKTTENEVIDDNESSSSVILLSSHSSSQSVSRNQYSISPELKSSEAAQRHISIDDADDEDNYFGENYDENGEEEEEDESVEIIESDGSEDLTGSFTNNIRSVTSTSTCSSLASILVSENTTNSGVLLQETVKAKNNGDELRSVQSTELGQTGDDEGIASFEKNTSQPELKLSVTSESINENEVVGIAAEKESIHEDRPVDEPISIKLSDSENQQSEPIEKVTEIEGEPKLVEPFEKESNKEDENIESQEQLKDEEIMEVEEATTNPTIEEDQVNTANQDQSTHSGTEQIEIEKSYPLESTVQKEEKLTENETSNIITENVIDLANEDGNNPDTIKSEEIEIIEIESVSSDQSIQHKNTQNEKNKQTEIEEKGSTLTLSSETISESQTSEKTAQTTDSIDEQNNDHSKIKDKSTQKIRAQSIPPLTTKEKAVPSPRTRRNSRSGSMPPVSNSKEIEIDINKDATISKVDSIDTVKHKILSEDLDLTPKLRNRRSSSVSKHMSSDTDAVASPSGRRISRGGSVPPSIANPIVTRRRSILLETLDEVPTPDSPSSRTRSKVRSDSIDDFESESSSVTKAKRTRRSSVSSLASVEQPQTPKTRRRSSMSVDKDIEGTPKAAETPRTSVAKSITADVTTTPIKTPRRLSVSKKHSPPEDTNPTTSKSKIPKKDEKNASTSPQNEAEVSHSEDYTTSRRLTRTQLAAMEKNLAMSKQPISPVVRKRRPSNTATEMDSPPDVKGSDNESNSSRMSRVSNSTAGRRVTRSSALKENASDDKASVASSQESGKRKRRKLKDQISPIAILKVIPEEVPSGSEGSANSETGKRPTRHKK